MKAPKPAKLLSLTAIERWFDTAKPPVHTAGVSMMDGFIAALAAGPAIIDPKVWIWHIIGDHDKRAYPGTRTRAVVNTIIDHYTRIERLLVENPGSYTPIFMRTPEGEVRAEDFANGFYGAMNLRLDEWKPIMADVETATPLMLILANCTTTDGDSIYGNEIKKVPADLVANSWVTIRDIVPYLRNFHEPYRKAQPKPAT
jgi:uncharacterized protein